MWPHHQHSYTTCCLAMVWQPDLHHSPVPCVLSISRCSHNLCYGGGTSHWQTSSGGLMMSVLHRLIAGVCTVVQHQGC